MTTPRKHFASPFVDQLPRVMQLAVAEIARWHVEEDGEAPRDRETAYYVIADYCHLLGAEICQAEKAARQRRRSRANRGGRR